MMLITGLSRFFHPGQQILRHPTKSTQGDQPMKLLSIHSVTQADKSLIYTKATTRGNQMAQLETALKSEIIRLAKKEVRKISVPMSKDVRSLKKTVSQLRRAVSALDCSTKAQQKQFEKRGVALEASPEEVKQSRLSPRLIKTLRNKLGISQKELAILSGVSIGAIHQWESGKFAPRESKKGVLVGLRKLGRKEARKMLEQKR